MDEDSQEWRKMKKRSGMIVYGLENGSGISMWREKENEGEDMVHLQAYYNYHYDQYCCQYLHSWVVLLLLYYRYRYY